MGLLMIDVEGLALTEEDKVLIQRDLVGGVILFSRNFASIEQLHELVQDIRRVRPDILIAVDHEGGRVQRFKQGFTHLPAMATLGQLYAEDKVKAIAYAEELGWLMAAELRTVDVDFSFAPVLDINAGISEVIGDRAFSSNVDEVIQLAGAFIQGMNDAGMSATGKHFPGHGAVAADSHTAIPVDHREWDVIWRHDIQPFVTLIKLGLSAVMPAHVIYDKLDAQPAGFSTFWLQDILLNQLQFNGVIFSDDLSMEGASVAGGYGQRAVAAISAGCTMVLVCNQRQGALEALSYLDNLLAESPEKYNAWFQDCIHRNGLMKGAAFVLSRDQLLASERWQKAQRIVSELKEFR